jgi:catechol 2,3-dioxygenase
MQSEGKEDGVSEPIHPEVRIGHAHLRVGDLERVTAFYRDVLGFDVIAYGPDFGMSGMVFLSAGGYHHHIALNTRHSAGGTPPPEGHTGLHHIAILYPNRREMAKAVKRVLDHGHVFTYAHQTPAGEAVYLDDPDGNGLELYYDNPREQWADEEGKPLVDTLFDIDLIEEMDPKSALEELGPT